MIVRDLFARMGIQVEESGFKKADALLGKLSGGFLKVSAVATAAAGALLAAVRSTAEAATTSSLAAKNLGLSTQQLQELEHAASRSHVSADELRGGLQELAHSAYIAATHGGHAGEAFYRLGVQVRGADGKIKSMPDLIEEVSDKLAEIENPIERTAIGMRLLGSPGVVNALGQGTKQIAALKREAHDLGTVMGTDLEAKSLAFTHAMGSLKDTLSGVRNAIADRVMPIFTAAAEAMAKWLTANKRLIASGIERVFETIARAIGGVWEMGKRLLEVFAPLIDSLSKMWANGGASRAVLIALGAAIASLVAPLTTAAAAAALLFEDLFLFFKNPKAKTITKELIEMFGKVAAKFTKIWDSDDPFGALYDYAEEFFDWLIGEVKKIPARVEAALGESLRKRFGPSEEQQKAMQTPWKPDFHPGVLSAIGRWLMGPGAEQWEKMGLKVDGGNVDPRYMGVSGIGAALFSPPQSHWAAAGAGSAPQINFVTTINAGADVDGKKLGADFASGAVPEIDAYFNKLFNRSWDRRLGEAVSTGGPRGE